MLHARLMTICQRCRDLNVPAGFYCAGWEDFLSHLIEHVALPPIFQVAADTEQQDYPIDKTNVPEFTGRRHQAVRLIQYGLIGRKYGLIGPFIMKNRQQKCKKHEKINLLRNLPK